MKNTQKENLLKEQERRKKEAACPDCGGKLIHQEGCLMCPICGYSYCG